MMTRVLCTASPKGGSGKTTVTATLASLLSQVGYRVLMIDTDAATNGLTLFYLRHVMLRREQLQSEGRDARGVYDGADESGIELTAVRLSPTLHLLPATYRASISNPQPDALRARLQEVLAEASGRYDFVFLDAQAGSDPLAAVAFSRDVSEQVILVSEYDPLSAAGVERMKALFPDDLGYGRTWILLNKVLPEFVKGFSDFLEVAKYLPPVAWMAEVVQAYSRRQLAIDLAKGNTYTLGLISTLQSLLGDDTKLEEWLESQAIAVKEPLLIKLEDAKKRRAGLMQVRKYYEVRQVRFRLAAIAALVAGVWIGVISVALGGWLMTMMAVVTVGVSVALWHAGYGVNRAKMVEAGLWILSNVIGRSSDLDERLLSDLVKPLPDKAEEERLDREITSIEALIEASPMDVIWQHRR